MKLADEMVSVATKEVGTTEGDNDNSVSLNLGMVYLLGKYILFNF